MQILHITPKSGSYEIVDLIANRVDSQNHLAAIIKDGEEYWTGGYLIEDTPYNREILEKIPRGEQYKFIKSLRDVPFAKDYLHPYK